MREISKPFSVKFPTNSYYSLDSEDKRLVFEAFMLYPSASFWARELEVWSNEIIDVVAPIYLKHRKENQVKDYHKKIFNLEMDEKEFIKLNTGNKYPLAERYALYTALGAITIKELAEQTGISRTTLSTVLNKPGARVSSTILKALEKYEREKDYQDYLTDKFLSFVPIEIEDDFENKKTHIKTNLVNTELPKWLTDKIDNVNKELQNRRYYDFCIFIENEYPLYAKNPRMNERQIDEIVRYKNRDQPIARPGTLSDEHRMSKRVLPKVKEAPSLLTCQSIHTIPLRVDKDENQDNSTFTQNHSKPRKAFIDHKVEMEAPKRNFLPDDITDAELMQMNDEETKRLGSISDEEIEAENKIRLEESYRLQAEARQRRIANGSPRIDDII